VTLSITPPESTVDLRKLIQAEADRCVKCGLCLPHCPTYTQARDEGESPRGRIALMQGVAAGDLPAGPRLEAHLDHCLSCRACERVCPSGVRYGELLNATRAILPSPAGNSGSGRRLADMAIATLTDRARARRLGRLLQIYQRSGLQWLVRRTALLRALRLARAEALVPAVIGSGRAWKAFNPARGTERSRVALFTGCASSVFDRTTISAAIRVLTATGHSVHVPAAQACCGALDLERGRRDRACALAAENSQVFNDLDVTAVLYVATGCGATLVEYGRSRVYDPDGANDTRPGIRPPIIEITRFLADAGCPDKTRLRPLRLRVAVHEPCSLRNVIRDVSGPYELLDNVPGIEIISLPGNATCCGAAGSHMLDEPDTADTLLADKIEALRASDASLLLTTNIGCSMHLAAGARRMGVPVEVLHPVTLIERQLEIGR
jgi:glycolate oxidase iron-sulfur subunit